MEWYEIIGLIAAWFLGLYLIGKFYEHKKNWSKNDSWKSKNKNRKV
jgi:hypothetical protein